MLSQLKINKNQTIPIYQQILDWVVSGINDGYFSVNTQLPSINQIATENQLARETVVKAFRLLQEKGIVKAVHGKGFFIASDEVEIEHRVFVLFDTFSAYKEILFRAIQDEFGENVHIDIYFHHFNQKIFSNLIKEAAGNYTAYLILPFDHPQITKMLEPVPFEKLYLMDRCPRFYNNPFHGVYQNFSDDVFQAFTLAKIKIKSYSKFILVFCNDITELPMELRQGFETLCNQNEVNHAVLEHALGPAQIEKNAVYLVIDDDDLVKLVEYAIAKKWKIGKDIGIISYNETPLKKVIAGGISVISTDFKKMGSSIVRLVKNNKKECVANPVSLIDRGSF